MPQGHFAQILDSGSEHKTKQDLHIQQAVYSCGKRAVVVPMRFRLVEHDPLFTKIAGDLAVFQDVICLTSNYRVLVDKVLKNLHCRLTRKCPKRPHWYFPWRKRQDLDIGFRLFITYQLGQTTRTFYGNESTSPKTYNVNEINEANWPDLITLFNSVQPGEAMFGVDWWIKGERMDDSVDTWKDASS
ncbi:unnamed protein product [Aureobasidium mustum]|uniref:Uncharacterized protein n=1 Tax=Aureobasidium mustum TaxID=2773714 RepID=A0A9N8JMH6_9PEZI|nr:unnamed protein product [Aureobasidium mustum]